MPSSKCDDPLRLPILKKSHKSKVSACSKDYINKCREYFKNVEWDDELQICARCRCEISDRIKRIDSRRETARAFFGNLLAAVPAAPPAEQNQGDGGSLDVSRSPEQGSQGFHTPDQTRSSDLLPGDEVEAGGSDESFPVSQPHIPPAPPTLTGLSEAPSTSDQGTAASSGVEYSDRYVDILKAQSLVKILETSPLVPGITRKPKQLRDKAERTGKKAVSFLEKLSETPLSTNRNCDCSYCVLMMKTIKERFPSLDTKKEKYCMLTCIPPSMKIGDIRQELNISLYMARQVSKFRRNHGPFYFPEFKTSAHPISQEVLDKVRSYYLNDENSRPDPSMHQTLKVRDPDGVIRYHAKRYMRVSARDAFEEFLKENEGSKISARKFMQMKPRQCKWPGCAGFPVTCACIIHENFALMLEGLMDASIDNLNSAMSKKTEKENENDRDEGDESEHDDASDQDVESDHDDVDGGVSEHGEGIEYDADTLENDADAAAVYSALTDVVKIVEFVVCQFPTENCFVGVCSNCPKTETYEKLFKYIQDEEVEFNLWETKPATTINKLSLPVDDFQERFVSTLEKFVVHHYIYQQQKSFISSLKNSLTESPTKAVINVDFGENYSFVVQTAVMGFHWSNCQATIHPFVVYFSNQETDATKYKTYFIISNELVHDATTFHVFRTKAIEAMKQDLPHITEVEYFSDGAGSQYKNFKNVVNLVYHMQDYNLKAKWHFSATSHGKSMCDAMSAVVKRTCRLKSIRDGIRILSAEEMFAAVNNTLTSETLQIMYVPKQEVDLARNALQERYDSARKIPGIRKLHFIGVADQQTIIGKVFSNANCHEVFTVVNNLQEPVAEPEDRMQFTIGTFVAVHVSRTYQVGKITSVNEAAEECEIALMKKAGKGGAALSWPEIPRERVIPFNDILAILSPPELTERGTYRISAPELEVVKQQLLLRIEKIRPDADLPAI